MGEVVNLRLQRKRAARRAAEAEAAENRTAHGLPKAVRTLSTRQAALEATRLDGHRLCASPGSAGRDADRSRDDPS